MHIREEILLRIHDQMIALYGGLPGMPNAERASAIIARVAQAEYYIKPRPDLYEIAAPYWIAIARGHIFNDANKRTALAVTLFFLERNGIFIRHGKDELAQLVSLTVDAATGARDADNLAAQLRTLALKNGG